MGPDTSTMLEQDESSSAQASANEISVPRLRPSSSLRQKPCNGIRLDVTTSAAAPTIPPPSKPYSRRSPSKARRKSIDGRPLIRSTTKISVRMKPRPAAATPTTAPAPTPTTSALPSPALSPSRRGRSSAPPRKVSSSYLRKVSCPSPRNVSIKAQGQDSDGGSPVGGTCAGGLGDGCDQRSSRAAGALRPRYSVSYRLAKAPRAAAAAAVPTTEPPPAEPLVEMSAEVQTRKPTATATEDSEGAEGENRSSIPPPPEQPTPLSGEAMRLEAAWREVRRRERQLEAREDALKLGQKRLRQDREALEKEKQRFQEKLEAQQEQQKTRTTTVNAAAAAHDEDNLRKRRAARRGRSRSKPRSKVVLPDDSWRRDHHKHQQQQDHRHSSWSSVNSSDAGTNASRHSSTSYPSDADSVTTATTRASSSSSFSPSPRSSPNPQSEPKPRPEFKPAPAPPRTWSPTDLVPSLTAYNTRWTSLSPRSAHIPYPSPNHTAAELVDATHLRSLLHLLLPLPHAAMEERRRILAAIVAGSSSGSHHDAVVQYNVAHFFLVARGVACRPVLSGGFGAAGAAVLKPDYGFGLRRVPVDGKDGVTLRALVKEVRGELRRWHEDGLKYRGGDDDDDGDGHRHAERKINEGLVKDETAKAVFRAFTELRDELLAEVRWRKDIATAAGDGVAADTRREERPRSGYGNGPEEDQNGGGVDWSVLSEAML